MSVSARRRTLLAVCVVAALAATASAGADEIVTELARDTPIAAYGGALAWSAYDQAADRYALVISRDGVTAPARIARARRAFDVSLGPDSRGRTVALYTRCTSANRGCDVYRYDLRTRRESKVRSVSSPSEDEAWPAQWRGRIAFSRRAETRVVSGFDHRPDPRRRGPVFDCDIPYVKTLASRAPSRRLDRSPCGATAGIAIRGETIVHVSGVSQGGAGSESQVLLLRARGGAARVLARTGGGEGGFSPFVSPNLSASSVWLTRTGQRQGVTPGFVRIDLGSGRLTTIPPNLNLAGRVARDERGRFWYVQGPEPDFDYHAEPPFCTSPLDPCRLVRASASPFSTAPRTLLPRLSIDNGFLFAFATDPPRLIGVLTRAVVRGGAVARREPLAGVAVSLLRTADIARPGPFAATGLTATTDAAGRVVFTLTSPPPEIALAVFAPALEAASIVVDVHSAARIALSAGGRTLTGTVAPSQPGRSVAIQRFSVDAGGRLPNGMQVCPAPATPRNCSDEAWATVAQAPLDATGTSFSAVVGAAGAYRAFLPTDPDPFGHARAYGGVSDAVPVS
jgi:hypothetical protein